MLGIHPTPALQLVHGSRAEQASVTTQYVYFQPSAYTTRPHCLITAVLIAAKLHADPNPTAVDVARWALEIEVSEVDAFRLVGELLSEAVKAQAAFEHSVRPSPLTCVAMFSLSHSS